MSPTDKETPEMPAHPKPLPKTKKPGAMRSAPKSKIVAALEEAATTPSEKATKVKVANPPKEAASAKPAAPEGQSKTEMVTAMLSTPAGATSKEIEEVTGWAPHSVRGLLGTMRKKGISVVSKKLKGEPTIYRIARGKAAAPEAATADVV